MRFQLRVATIRPGAMDAWLAEWEEHVRPLRLAHGFSIVGPWVADDDATFVWVLGHDIDFDAAETAYACSDELRAFAADPTRHVEREEARFMRSPSRGRARGR